MARTKRMRKLKDIQTNVLMRRAVECALQQEPEESAPVERYVFVYVVKATRDFFGFYDGKNSFTLDRKKAAEYERTGFVPLHFAFAKDNMPKGCELLKVFAETEDFSGPWGKSHRDDSRITSATVFGDF
jgi:hypothetical protein